jgi:AcrR family transcriptional regulator
MSVTETGVRGRAREAVLDAADRLFYRGGIRATSVDAVADEAGVTKRTLYHHFESKDELVSAYLERRDEPTRQALARRAEALGETPGTRIVALFGLLEQWFERNDYRGCPFLNAASECGNDERVRIAAAKHKDGTQAWFAAQLSAAGASDPEGLARMLVLALDGAMARALIYRSAVDARSARTLATILLENAGVDVRAGA